MITATPTHADRLAAAAAITAKARQSITEADDLAAEVSKLKLAAAGGDLDDRGAAELVRLSEAARIADITKPRRARILADAEAAEVKVGLEVLAALSDALAPLEADAAQAADLLTAALVDPAAAALEADIVLARELGVARCWVEKAAPGVYGASVLRERLKAAGQVTWGSAHVPVEAALIVSTFDAEVAGIKSGTAMLKSILKAAQKARD
jgi:hypothetical protein